MIDCSCKFNDAWRCASSRRASYVACPCACHRAIAARTAEDVAVNGGHPERGPPAGFVRVRVMAAVPPRFVADYSGPMAFARLQDETFERVFGIQLELFS